jgi:hypothetical protein
VTEDMARTIAARMAANKMIPIKFGVNISELHFGNVLRTVGHNE